MSFSFNSIGHFFNPYSKKIVILISVTKFESSQWSSHTYYNNGWGGVPRFGGPAPQFHTDGYTGLRMPIKNIINCMSKISRS